MSGSFWHVLDEDGEETMTWVEDDSSTANISYIDMSNQVELKLIKTHDEDVIPSVNNNEQGKG